MGYNAIWKFFKGVGVNRLSRWLLADRPLVLSYHGVLGEGHDSKYFPYRNFVNFEIFCRQMAFISERLHPVPLQDIVDYLYDQKKLPPNAVAISFDDGYRSVLDYALPVLTRYMVPATVFVSSDYVDTVETLWAEKFKLMVFKSTAGTARGPENHMYAIGDDQQKEVFARSWLQSLKRMEKSERDACLKTLEGWLLPEIAHCDLAPLLFLNREELQRLLQSDFIEIGGHTASHEILSTMSDEDAEADLEKNASALAETLGKPVSLFAYPNGQPGDFTRQHQNMLAGLGYSAAFTQLPGWVDKGINPFEVPRFDIGGGHDMAAFEAILSKSYLLKTGLF